MICITDNIRDNVIDAVDVSVLSNLEDAQVDGEPDLIVDLIDLSRRGPRDGGRPASPWSRRRRS